MDEEPDQLEIFWDDLLSRIPERVQAAFSRLDLNEQQAVLKHLGKMSSEPGWHPEQRRSAESALAVLENGE